MLQEGREEGETQLIVVDSFANCSVGVLAGLQRILGPPPPAPPTWAQSSQTVRKVAGSSLVFLSHRLTVLRGDAAQIATILPAQLLAHFYPVHGIVHFAGLKAVGESVLAPLQYHSTNTAATVALAAFASSPGALPPSARRPLPLVFSSSATVYGATPRLPITEATPSVSLADLPSPYGKTKAIGETILADLHAAQLLAKDQPTVTPIILRYFNPVGAHPSGHLGESPVGRPNNLFPFISQVAAGVRPQLSIFGTDYDTVDGTGVRDYIHVVDLAAGHVAALRFALQRDEPELHIFNLGTGTGSSVRQVVEAFRRASGRDIPTVDAPRRPGDPAAVYADVTKARDVLGFSATKTLDEMCEDGWRWQQGHPTGFADDEFCPDEQA